MALGRLLAVLLAILRQPELVSLPELSFNPESPAFGMVFRHMAKNPHVLEAFQREDLYLIDPSGATIRFRRYPQTH
jgi:hypothetical protein